MARKQQNNTVKNCIAIFGLLFGLLVASMFLKNYSNAKAKDIQQKEAFMKRMDEIRNNPEKYQPKLKIEEIDTEALRKLAEQYKKCE